MRFVVFGAGAVGGVVGGRLYEHGHDVLLIARGPHAKAIAATGLTLASAAGVVVLPVPVTQTPEAVDWRDDDVVLLAVKSQDTETALRQLGSSAPGSVPVACVQNGVANEQAALRRFANVYGVCVMCPASHLEPGVVVASSSPVTALLDIGRYPTGVDDVAEAVAAAFGSSTIESVARPDIMRWKYAKLLRNLGNAVDAICGPGQRDTPLAQLALEEGEACLRAAGIAFASAEEDAARRGNRLHPGDDVSGFPAWWQFFVAKPGPARRNDRGRLPQRRNSHARTALWGAHPGKRVAPACRRRHGSGPASPAPCAQRTCWLCWPEKVRPGLLRRRARQLCHPRSQKPGGRHLLEGGPRECPPVDFENSLTQHVSISAVPVRRTRNRRRKGAAPAEGAQPNEMTRPRAQQDDPFQWVQHLPG